MEKATNVFLVLILLHYIKKDEQTDLATAVLLPY